MHEIKQFPAVADREKKSSVYSAKETQEARTTAIQKAIDAQLDLLVKAPIRTDLSDLPAVREVAERYIARCGEAGICPSYEGLAASLGISRNYSYEFLRKHKNSATSEFLNNLRLGFASLRMALAEARVLDPASVIFILKNSGFGMADRTEVSYVDDIPDEDALDAIEAEARIRRYIEDMVDDNE